MFSAFVSGNFQFIYKNIKLISSSKNPEDNMNLLNDVLFSHMKHPNSGIEWDLLYSVISHQPSDYICPICLFKPVSPRITPCGHIFCVDCITSHMTFNHEKATCPVCYESLIKKTLIRTDLKFFEKDIRATFNLVVKNRNNCCVFVAEDQNNMKFIPYASALSSVYSKISIADAQYMNHMKEKEIQELKEQVSIYSNPLYRDDMKVSMLLSFIDLIEKEIVPESNEPPFYLQPECDLEFFYQDSSGRQAFLDPLSVSMIKKHFGSLVNAPSNFSCPVLKTTYTTVSQRFRRKYPYLGHLSSGADITFILCDLSQIVSNDIILEFDQIIQERIKVDEPEEEDEEEEIAFKQEDFPSIAPVSEVKPSQKKGWGSITISKEDDFPSLSKNSVVPTKNTKWAQISTEKKPNDDFPSLTQQKPQPKRTNSWANVK